MNNSFGLSEENFELIKEKLKEFKDVDKAIVFGSRAMGTYKNNSDIDIAIKVKSGSYFLLPERIKMELETLPILNKFDVVNYNEIENISLKKHIDTEGKEI